MEKRELELKAREVSTKMTEQSQISARIALQYEAHMTLYNVAAFSGDEETMKKEREILHSLLDHLLDTGSQVGLGQRKMDKLLAQYSSFI